MKELLNIYDENLNSMGILPRSEVHAKGLLHQVVHCWIYEIKDNETWIYLQRRSFNKTNENEAKELKAFSADGKLAVNMDRNIIVLHGREYINSIIKYLSDI